MEDEGVYATPKAEVLAGDKFQTFGGWLRFYQALNIISITFIVLMTLMVGVFSAYGEYAEGELFEQMIAAIELIPDLLITVMILRIIKIKEKDIPTRIVKYLGYYVAASLVMYAFVYYLFKTGVVEDKPMSFWGSVIYFLIWRAYFNRSRRVEGYYGENALG